MKSLVVEDDLTSRLVLIEILSSYGRCDAFASGEEGVASFSFSLGADKAYDLVCLDVGLPGISGQEVMAQIRDLEKEKDIPLGRGTKILMITASADKSKIFEAFRSSCDGYLVKPYNHNKLEEHISDFGLI
ncbi:MAG: response regulator [Planctomycetes bacterium]|nr:response regulator [Planctomycetota bacterium]